MWGHSESLQLKRKFGLFDFLAALDYFYLYIDYAIQVRATYK